MIVYRTGDATLPPEKPAVLAHIVNDMGYWGRGYTAALDARFGPSVKASYLAWRASNNPPFVLGNVASVQVSDVTIVHLLAQHGVGRSRQRLVYAALAECLGRLVAYPILHVPRMGAGLGGGSWPEIAPMLAGHPSIFLVYIPEVS